MSNPLIIGVRINISLCESAYTINCLTSDKLLRSYSTLRCIFREWVHESPNMHCLFYASVFFPEPFNHRSKYVLSVFVQYVMMTSCLSKKYSERFISALI